MSATATLGWQTRPVVPCPQPDPEPNDLATCLGAPNGLDLVVEMAHDLRSPLTSILFLAEAMQHGTNGPVNDAQHRSLALIYSAALSLCTAASDVLELARGGNQLVDRRPQSFSLSEVMGSVRDMVLPLAEQKGLEVRLVHAVPERRVGHPRGARAPAPQPSHERGEVHRHRLRGNRGATVWRRPARVIGPRHWQRLRRRSTADAISAVAPDLERSAQSFLKLRPRARDLPQAR